MSDFSSIFSSSHCVSKTQLLAYMQQKLDKEENYLVESHLNDCQFCNDALDALIDTDLGVVNQDLLEAKTALEKKLFPVLKVESTPIIQENFEQKFEISKKTFTRWLAAASVLLLIGLGGYSVFSFINSQKNDLANNEEGKGKSTYDAKYAKKDKEHDEIVRLNVEENDTFRKYAEESTTATNSKLSPIASTRIPKTTTVADEVTKQPEALENDKVDERESKTVEKFEPQAAPVAVAKTPIAQNEKFDAAPGMDNFVSNNKEDKPQAPVAKEVAKKKSGGGMKNDNVANMQSNQLNYPKAPSNNDNIQRNQEQAVGQREENSGYRDAPKELTDFEQGMDLFNNRNYKKSVSYFEKALKKAVGAEREDIMYHLALAYENIGKTEKAIELYAGLSKSKKYSVNAGRKLQEVNSKESSRKK